MAAAPANAKSSPRVDKAVAAGKCFAVAIINEKFLLVAGCTLSVCLMLEGFLCFGLCASNVRSYILSFYYILFGGVSIAAELRYELINKYMRIIFSYSGRGIWYVFLGSIALGGEWWSILIAILLMMIGAVNVFAGCQRGMASEGEGDHDMDPAIPLPSESLQEEVNVEIDDNDDQELGANKQPVAIDDNANPFSDYEQD